MEGKTYEDEVASNYYTHTHHTAINYEVLLEKLMTSRSSGQKLPTLCVF